ncbi:MAG: aldehyde dehydrogenase family protein, partial [Congregibacter sp.]|nr:aldehyde dehydrogenase family protein [Congregibacter sp.]
IKNGQMCVSVDYALVSRGDLAAFVDEAKAFVAKSSEDYTTGENCTGMISARHQARIAGMLEEARERKSQIATLGSDPSADDEARRMPISLVIDPDDDLAIMQEEIFGPIIPVVPYDNLDEAIARINAGERPLALYVFGDNQSEIDRVVNETSSGGVAINTCAVQAALPSLGFGGSGNSGMGRHHGIQGFYEFSNPRGMFKRGEGDMIGAFYDHEKGSALVEAALSEGH